MSTPDYSQYIIGWRVWRVENGMLWSPFTGSVWEPGKPFQIDRSRYDGWSDELSNPLNRGLGIFALKKPPRGMVIGGSLVVGRVALWGTVHEHTKGYRAQYAYPLSIRRVSGRRINLEPIRKTYGMQAEPKYVFNSILLGLLLWTLAFGVLGFLIGSVVSWLFN